MSCSDAHESTRPSDRESGDPADWMEGDEARPEEAASKPEAEVDPRERDSGEASPGPGESAMDPSGAAESATPIESDSSHVLPADEVVPVGGTEGEASTPEGGGLSDHAQPEVASAAGEAPDGEPSPARHAHSRNAPSGDDSEALEDSVPVAAEPAPESVLSDSGARQASEHSQLPPEDVGPLEPESPYGLFEEHLDPLVATRKRLRSFREIKPHPWLVPGLDPLVADLEENRLAIVRCMDEDLLLDLPGLCLQRGVFAEVDGSELLTNAVEEDGEHEVRDLFAWVGGQSSHGSFVALRVCGPSAAGALASSVRNKWLREDLLRRLRRTEAWVLCLLDESAFQSLGHLADEQRVHDIDFLEPMVRRRCEELGQPSESEEVLRLFESYRRCSRVSPQEFHTEVRQLLRTPTHAKLLDALHALEEGVAATEDLSGSELRRAMAFVATEFPRLSLTEFETLLSPILVGAQVPVERTVTRTKKSGRRITQVEIEPVDAWEHWRLHSDDVLDSAKLCTIELDEDRTVIDFQDAAAAKRTAESLRKRYGAYRERSLERLYHSGILFDPETPDEVVARLTRRVQALAEARPHHYSTEWLRRSVNSLYRRMIGDAAHAAARANFAGELNSLLGLIEQQVGRTAFFFRRLANLCLALLETKTGADTVERFLGLLAKEGGGSPGELWRLVRLMRLSDSFDAYPWIERILHQAQSGIRLEALKVLLLDAMESSVALQDTLTQLRTWLPRRDAQQLNGREKYALAFLPEYILHASIHQLGTLEAGGEIEHPLFGAVRRNEFEEDGAYEAWLEGLCDWLLHPHLGVAYTLVLRDSKAAKQAPGGVVRRTSSGLMVEALDAMSEVVEQCQDEECREQFDRFVGLCGQRSTGKERHRIRDAIQGRRVHYQRVLATLGQGPKERERVLRARRARKRLAGLKSVLQAS